MRQSVLPLLLCAVTAAGAADYFVSPDGDDAHSGRGPTRAQALATISAGVAKLAPGDTLHVRAGVYRETVVFPRSGTADQPIVVQPYQGERVVVSGCEEVGGWTLHDAAQRIWRAPMPWTLGLGRNQVFASGQVLREARHPNTPDPDLGMYVSDLSPLWPTFGEFSLPRETMKAQPGRIVSKHLDGQADDWWKGALYYGVHYEGWCAQTGVVESSKPGEIFVGDRTRTWWFGPAYGGNYAPEEGRGMLVGHLHALDAPGEWHWQDNQLYLIPPGAQPPAAVEAKRRQLAFDLSGRAHITVRGLGVHAASVRLQDSAFCTFERCDLRYVSHYTRHYDIGQVERGRDTIKSGETGLFVGGHDNAFLSCSVRFSAGTGFWLRGYHHTIHNCLIDEVGYTAHYVNAITDAVSDFPDYEHFLVGGHRITYNTMRNAGRHFFNFYGNGPSTASRTRSSMDYMATLFAHNHLYNGMLQTKDAGFLTSYYASGGTLNGLNSQVCYNVMHDSYDLAAMRWNVLGIVYLDAGSCDVDLWNNLLWAAPGSLQRGLWYNTMCVDIHERDNVFWPQFTRTSAELEAKDFPRGVPFRFGHDFDAPPPLAQWPQLVQQRRGVEQATALAPGLTRTATGVSGLRDGDWLALEPVDWDQGWQSAVLRFASARTDLNIDRAARQAPRHQKTTDPLVLEVKDASARQDKIRSQWTFVYNVNDGAWLRFGRVPLGDGYRRFRVVYGNDQPTARKLEVRLDALDGPLVGQVDLPPTDKPRGGRVQVYAEATGVLDARATGTHDLCLIFRSPDAKPVGEFEYFRCEQYRGAIPLARNEVKFELRLGARDGEKIGEFHPRGTGGADTWRDLVAPLEPARGRQPLYLVVRSAAAGALGDLDWLSLERARQPVDWTGVGDPPLRRDGKLVLPPATHRPCARPADKIRAASTSPLAARSIAAARPCDPAPTIDGRLDEWPTGDQRRTVLLAQDYDGSPAKGPASQAWLAYDRAALYVALRHPVRHAAKLLPSSHEWGAVDGTELAFEADGVVQTLYGFPDGHFVSADYGGASPAQQARLQAGVTYRAAVGADAWTCEWRVPFAAAGLTPQAAPVVGFNLGVRKTDPESWVIWRGTGGATWQVARGGLLAFPTELLAGAPPTGKLEVHLDADAPDAVTTDAEGKVARWQDRSGKQRDATQPDARYRPRLVPAGLGGRPVLRFDEQDKTRLELPDLAPDKLSGTVWAVISNPVAGSEVNHDPRIFTASDGKGFDYQIGIALSVPGMETGGPRIVAGGFRDAWAKQVRVGCFSPNYQTFFTGLIAEILVYSRPLTPAEQDRLRARLSVKWGLAEGG